MTAIRTVLDISGIVNDAPGAHQYALQKAASGPLVPVSLNLTQISNGGGSVAVGNDGNAAVTGGDVVFDNTSRFLKWGNWGYLGATTDSFSGTHYVYNQGARMFWHNGVSLVICVPTSIINSNPAQPAQILQAATGQTAPLQNWLGSDGSTVLASVDATGRAEFAGMRLKQSNSVDLIFEDTLSATTAGIRYNGLELHFLNYLGGYSATLDSTGQLTIGGITIAGHQILTSQQAAIANATNATDVITQLNSLLTACRTHGLIST